MANSKKKTSTSSNTKSATKTSTKKTTSTAKKATTKTAAKKTTAKAKTPVVKTEVKVKETKKNKINIIDWCKENYTIIGLVLLAILLIVNIIIVSVGHQVKLNKNGEEIIATLDGKQFTAEDLFEELKDSNGSDTLINMIDAYIVEKEITDDEKVEAKKQAQDNIDSIKEQYTSAGYTWEDVLAQYGYTDEEALLDEITLSTEKEIIAKNYIKADLTDEEIEKYYNENVYGKYTAKHILITPDTNDDMTDEEVEAAEAEAKATAEEVIEKLNNGEDWSKLVKEYSEDTGSNENEGLVENFTHGDVVDEFWDAVEGLKDGKYTTEPVKSSYGYHIIYRVSYTEKEALNDMKDDLVDEIVEKKLSDDSTLYTTTWFNIRKKYNLEIKDTTLKAKYESSKESE